MPNSESEVAFNRYERTPRHFLELVDKFLRILFGDGQLAAIRAAFNPRLGSPPLLRVRTETILKGTVTVGLTKVSMEGLQERLKDFILGVVLPLDGQVCKMVTEEWAAGDWTSAIEGGRSLLSPPVIWMVPPELESALGSARRRSIVMMPGRGAQPGGRLLEDDYYLCPDLPRSNSIYGFRKHGGAIWFPIPLQVEVSVEETTLSAHVERPVVVTLVDTHAARRVCCASG